MSRHDTQHVQAVSFVDPPWASRQSIHDVHKRVTNLDEKLDALAAQVERLERHDEKTGAYCMANERRIEALEQAAKQRVDAIVDDAKNWGERELVSHPVRGARRCTGCDCPIGSLEHHKEGGEDVHCACDCHEARVQLAELRERVRVADEALDQIALAGVGSIVASLSGRILDDLVERRRRLGGKA